MYIYKKETGSTLFASPSVSLFSSRQSHRGLLLTLSRERAACWARRTQQRGVGGGPPCSTARQQGPGPGFPRLTTEGSGGRQVSRFFFTKNSAHE